MHSLFDNVELILLLLQLTAMGFDEQLGGLVIVLPDLLFPAARVVNVGCHSVSLLFIGIAIATQHVIVASQVLGMRSPCVQSSTTVMVRPRKDGANTHKAL